MDDAIELRPREPRPQARGIRLCAWLCLDREKSLAVHPDERVAAVRAGTSSRAAAVSSHPTAAASGMSTEPRVAT
ncbi:MAG TPA: hypothetical protein VKT77_05560 [Chthonomonadaceae bacterium]|nr:hypothetical protein [Chthonomonadaceae bacterium]